MSFLPGYMEMPSTMLEGYVRLDGNTELINNIIRETKNYISIGKSLYETQEGMKKFLTHKYGEDWYLKNGEGVNFIIENEHSRHIYGGKQ